MALANFFDKTALGAAQVLNGFDLQSFQSMLSQTIVEIAFDKNATDTFEGRCTLDLLTRLLSRLYPSLKFNNIDSNDCQILKELEELAWRINPEITFSENESTITIVVGITDLPNKNKPTFYVGSKNWTLSFSQQKAIGSSESNNPFGAGAAACIGAANIFRQVFKDQLPHGKIDSDFSLSTFSFKKDQSPSTDPILSPHLHADTILVGLGAIGNATAWALSWIHSLVGELTIVDHEKIALSNLQRYVLAEQSDIDQPKVDVISERLKATKLHVRTARATWADYLHERKDFNIDSISVGVDSAEDRIYIQGALPKKIFNAWTQPEALGISRHEDFINNACLTCLYLPTERKKNRSTEIAENLGLFGTENEQIIRQYLANNLVVDEALLSRISSAKTIPMTELLPYLNKNIDVFYSEVVCGGVLLKLSNDKGDSDAIKLQVPSAFESALAGILLAAEIVIDSSGIKREIPNISRVNLLRPITNYLLENHEKNESGRCICQDQTYVKAYQRKYR